MIASCSNSESQQTCPVCSLISTAPTTVADLALSAPHHASGMVECQLKLDHHTGYSKGMLGSVAGNHANIGLTFMLSGATALSPLYVLFICH